MRMVCVCGGEGWGREKIKGRKNMLFLNTTPLYWYIFKIKKKT